MPLITTNDSQWANVYALASAASVARGEGPIPVGTALYVQNQSSEIAYGQLVAAVPAQTDQSGRQSYPRAEDTIDAGAPGLFMRCSPGGLRLYVQRI